MLANYTTQKNLIKVSAPEFTRCGDAVALQDKLDGTEVHFISPDVKFPEPNLYPHLKPVKNLRFPLLKVEDNGDVFISFSLQLVAEVKTSKKQTTEELKQYAEEIESFLQWYLGSFNDRIPIEPLELLLGLEHTEEVTLEGDPLSETQIINLFVC